MDVTAMEMTKWFDTNYHYIVPELGPRDELLAVVHEALRRARRGDGGAGDRHRAGDRRPGLVPAARQVRRRRARGLRPPEPARAAARGLRRGDRAPRRAGRDLGPARRALLRRGPLRARARRAAARLRGAGARSTSAPGSASRPTSTTSATPTACSATSRSRASGSTSIEGRRRRPGHGARGPQERRADRRRGRPRGQVAVRRDRRRPQRLDQRARAQPRPARRPARPLRRAGRLHLVLAPAHARRPRRRAALGRARRRAALLDGVRQAEGRRGRDARSRASARAARRSPASSTRTTGRSRTGATPIAPATPPCATGSRRSPTRTPARQSPFEVRREAQRARLDLPLFPTTTIGSYPQTAEIRQARAELRAGRDRRGRVRAPHALRDRARDPLPGGGRPRRARPRRARAQRHGPVLRRAARGLRLHPERLGAVLRLALRAPADHLRRRQPAARR